MLQAVLSLRYIMLIASAGAALGALVMFWQGAAGMVGAAHSIIGHEDHKQVMAQVMGSTDVFLFGVVLVIFAYAIAFGFVIDLAPEERKSLPTWMRRTGMGELKATLVGVILVYLIVDFATDWAQNVGDLTWVVLTKPLSILILAIALRLFAPTNEAAHKTKSLKKIRRWSARKREPAAQNPSH